MTGNSTMADMDEALVQDANFSTDQHFPSSECAYQQAESPGTKRLQDLATTELEFDEPEVSAKLMERPISSGSAELQGYTYGAAPKRDLQIAKKPATALFGVSNSKLRARPPTRESPVEHGSALQADRERSPLDDTPERHSNQYGKSKGQLDSRISPVQNTNALMADDADSSQIVHENSTKVELEPNKSRASAQNSLPDMSRKTAMWQRVDLAPPSQRLFGGLNVMPISTVDTMEHDTGEQDGETVDSHQNMDEASPTSTRARNKGLQFNEHTKAQQNTRQVVDLTLNEAQCKSKDNCSKSSNEDRSPTQVEGDNKSSSGSDPEQPHPKKIRQVRVSVERDSPAPKTPLQPARPSRVYKQRPVSQQQLSLRQSGEPGAPTGRTPSEEDLYYLLLHRYRKREQSEKQLAARLRQLENENTELVQTAQEYQGQLEHSITSNNKQAAEIRAQKMLINDIKNRHSKIKKYMTDVYEQQNALRTKATSINQDSQALRSEHNHIRHVAEEARKATASSSEHMNKFKTDLAAFRRDSACLEMSLHDARLELQSQQSLLSQERRRNTKYENHITDITRQQNNFRFTVQREQQNLLNTLQCIKNKLFSLEIQNNVPSEAPNLPALNHCVEMLQTLTQVDTATSADVTDMVQAVQGLSENFASFQKQSKESLQQAAGARAESDAKLLSQVTEQLKTLVHESANQKQIAELEEAKIRLEERIRGNVALFTEIRNGKAAAEKREDDLKASHGKIVDELARLRETALASKKSAGTSIDHQTLLMKWTNTNNLLAESLQNIECKDQKLQAQEEQIQSLSAQLSQERDEQEKSAEEIQRLSERLPERSDQVIRAKEQLLAEKEAFITGLQEEMRQSRSTCSDQQKEIEEVKSARDTLIKDLDEAKLRLEQETRDRAAAKSTIDRLNQQLLEIDYLREQADCVPRLVHDLEIKGRTIVNLQQEVGLLKATTEQFKGHHLDAERKTTEIAELNQKLLTANEAVQQIPVLEEKLSEYKEEIQSLKDAHERVRSLESGMIQKNEHIGQLNIKLTDLDKTLAQLNNTEAEMNRWKNDYESMKAKFEATEEEAARTGMLEEELAAKEDEIGKLRTKLTEAETISNVIPEMQEKMDQFCEAFKKLRSELEEAQQAKEELESTKAKNATLQKTVAELCEKTAMAQQTSNPMECLGLEIRQRDAQIAELRERLAHLEVESQPRNPVGDQDAENLQQGLSPQADHLVASLVQQGSVRQDNAQPVVDESEIVSTVQEAEPRRRRKRADRSASGQQAKVNVTDHEMSATKTLEGTGSALDAVHKTVTEQADQGQALVAQQLDETDVVPESQPRTKDLLKSPNAKEQVGAVEDAPLTSSPLSDIGDIFDSPNRGQPGHSQRSGPQEQDDENGEPVLGDGMASQLLLGPEEQLSKSTDSTHRVEGPSQERRLPSSSYGDSLLLDDLAGLGSWPVSPGSHGARSRRSTRGTQEVLTSPAGVMPAKQSRLSTRPRLTTTSFSRTDIKASDRFQHGRDAAEDTSPSRLRRTKRASQNDQVEMRADTPSISIKEKHQPNSAIKRKAEAAGIFDEIMSPEKKSARKNLSNLETAGRPGTRSRSLSSSIPGKNKQSLSGFKQSSVSSTTRRSGIIGKNAPTSGAGKQGSKKPKGSSRSEESVIITIKRGY